MKEREPLNFAWSDVAPPVGRRWTILGGGIFNRNYAEFSTGVDTIPGDEDPPPEIGSPPPLGEGPVEDFVEIPLPL